MFCDIVRGQSPASVVYENARVLAFMNHRQANPGHVLVIPKRHVQRVHELDPTLAGDLFRAVTLVARAIQFSFCPEGLTIWQSNGEAAGQEVPHVHVHLLPRRTGDGNVAFYPTLPPVRTRVELDALASQLREQISSTLTGSNP